MSALAAASLLLSSEAGLLLTVLTDFCSTLEEKARLCQ